jgi:hypothetical protein
MNVNILKNLHVSYPNFLSFFQGIKGDNPLVIPGDVCKKILI